MPAQSLPRTGERIYMNSLKHAEPAADSGLVQFARTRPSLALPTAFALVVIAVPLLVSASGRAEIRERTRQMRITERDFSISAPRILSPGAVSLRVRNAGPNTHELVVARADASRLPLRSDGLTVDEESTRAADPGGHWSPERRATSAPFASTSPPAATSSSATWPAITSAACTGRWS